MLTSLRLRRFKAFRDSGHVRLAPLTVLFGENGTGKSSFAQLLRAMRQTVEAGLPPSDLLLEGASIDLGHFEDVIHRHEVGDAIEVALELDEGPPGARALALETRLRAAPLASVARCVAGTIAPRSADVACAAIALPDEASDAAARALLDALARALLTVTYLGPHRAPPAGRARPGEASGELGAQGEGALQALFARRDEALELGGARRTASAHVDAWLRRLGLAHSLELTRAGDGALEARVRLRPDGHALRLGAVGSRLAHVLPVVVACVLAPRGALLLLEEPELHLHPGVQAELADLFVEASAGGRAALLVESHSEPLLQRLQRRVAEGAIAPGALALHHVRREGDEARVTALELDAQGNVLRWPERFFGDPMADLLERAKLALPEDER